MIESILSNVAKVDIGIQHGDSYQGLLTTSPISEVFAWQAKQTREQRLLFVYGVWIDAMRNTREWWEGTALTLSPCSNPPATAQTGALWAKSLDTGRASALG